jgi:hypothetical protein
MMKLYAQSAVPPRVPFIHVGYAAVKGVLTGVANSAAGTGSLLLAGTLLVVVLLSRSPRENPKDAASVSRPRRLKGRVLVVAAIVCGGLGLFLLSQGSRYSATGRKIEPIHIQIIKHIEQGEAAPEDLASLKTMLDLSDSDLLDGWGRSLAIVEHRDGLGHQRGLGSAGTDGEFGTEDDLTYFYELIDVLPENSSDESSEVEE